MDNVVDKNSIVGPKEASKNDLLVVFICLLKFTL